MKHEHESWIDELGLQQIDLKKIDDEDDNLKKFDSQYLELPWNFSLQLPSLCKTLPWPPIHFEENKKKPKLTNQTKPYYVVMNNAYNTLQT
jgi:hypothetical protein